MSDWELVDDGETAEYRRKRQEQEPMRLLAQQSMDQLSVMLGSSSHQTAPGEWTATARAALRVCYGAP